jgi:hypothetical protein
VNVESIAQKGKKVEVAYPNFIWRTTTTACILVHRHIPARSSLRDCSTEGYLLILGRRFDSQVTCARRLAAGTFDPGTHMAPEGRGTSHENRQAPPLTTMTAGGISHR